MNMKDFGKSAMSVGPWGGQDGFRWDDGVYSGVRQLVIAHGAGIDSIRIEYDSKGSSVWSEKHGGSGGLKTDKVKLNFPEEYLTSIHGHYGNLDEWGPVFVRSLTFETNKKTYGPYGIEHGTDFSFPMIGGQIVGFHGRCGWYLDAVGAYLDPLFPKPNPSKAMVQSYYVTGGTDKSGYSGYSVVQGSIGNNYDILVAFRQKNGYTYQSPKKLSRQTSSSSSDSDSKDHEIPGVPVSVERVSSKNNKGVVSYGAWGGSGGTVFDDGVYRGVREIHLKRNVAIVSIQVLYEQSGEVVKGRKNGGAGSFITEKIILDYPYEILTHITGYYGPTMKMGPIVIKSLSFHTTKTKYGPFGEEQGQHFTSNLKEGKIVGFHGRKGLFLDAIGVHVAEGKWVPPTRPPSTLSNQGDSKEAKVTPGVHLPSNSSAQGESKEAKVTPRVHPPFKFSAQGEAPRIDVDKRHWSNKLTLARKGATPTDELSNRVVKEPAQCETGPWGGEGGRPWDDGVFLGIKQIYLCRKEAICSMQIEYDRNGQSVWSVKHGGDGGTPIPIKLEYPHEVLICISGFYGPINGDHGPRVIKSLTFITSRRKYGPYGEELGTFFSSITTEGKIVGFHGRNGIYLDAIGVHMQHWLGNNKTAKSSMMKMFY